MVGVALPSTGTLGDGGLLYPPRWKRLLSNKHQGHEHDTQSLLLHLSSGNSLIKQSDVNQLVILSPIPRLLEISPSPPAMPKQSQPHPGPFLALAAVLSRPDETRQANKKRNNRRRFLSSPCHDPSLLALPYSAK